MRRLALIAVLCLAPAGCGGEDEPPAPPPRGVLLTLSAPSDAATVSDERVEVRGRVVPSAAQVRVLGRRVEVRDGRFAAEVELDEGANVIDVAASASGRRPASTAVRVVREVPVEIPDLEGADADEAVAELRALRLEVRTTEGGGLLDDLLPGEEGVCALDPEAGTKVRPGTTVTVEVAKGC